jgi:Zn finger protein HypA/HybF involved in hydrogenase expression
VNAMARPPTPEDERRSFHTTINLTQSERKALETIGQGVPITRLAVAAIQDFIAKETSSFSCEKGHTFWLEFGSMEDVKCCPICESKAIRLQGKRRYV